MTSLSAKIAWVTGAGSGIGEAAALALAGAGATVVLTGRRKQALETVARKIETAKGRARVEAGDVTDAGRVNAIAAAIRNAFGRLESTTPGPICASAVGRSLRRSGSIRSWPAIFPARSMSWPRPCR